MVPEKSRKSADQKSDTTTTTPLAMGQQMVDSIVLEEGVDPEYNPTKEEVEEYAIWLGMDLDKDKDLIWIAREGLKSPLPENWKPCKTVDTEEIYYFNFQTGESTWDHPCDAYYRKMYEDHSQSRRLQKIVPHDDGKKQHAGRALQKIFLPGKDKIKSKKARASSTLSEQYGKEDDSPRPNKKAAKGLREDIIGMTPRHLTYSSGRSTLSNENAKSAAAPGTASVPAESDITVGDEEPLTFGITTTSLHKKHIPFIPELKEYSSLMEKERLQMGRLRLVRDRPKVTETEVETKTEKEGRGRLQALHDKIIIEEENQKADAKNLLKLQVAREEAENKVEKLERQLKEGIVASTSAEDVDKDVALKPEQQQKLSQVTDEVVVINKDDNQVQLLKEKAESLETVVATLKEKLEVEMKNKEKAECVTSDALKEVSRVNTVVEVLQAAEIVLKDDMEHERRDKEESQRAAKDLLSDLESSEVHHKQQLLEHERRAKQLRAKLEETQQFESERRQETKILLAKQIEMERQLKDGNVKLDESQQLMLERKQEIKRHVERQIETERKLNCVQTKLQESKHLELERRAENDELKEKVVKTEKRLKGEQAEAKGLRQLESKRRAETESLIEKQIETERKLKDEEKKTIRAKKEWERKVEKAQKEMSKFVTDAKMQAIDLQKQISSLREAGGIISKRKKEDKNITQQQPSSTTTTGLIPSEELRLVTMEQIEGSAAATLEIKHLTEEVLTLEASLAQSREIDADMTAKLHESEDQVEQLKQQLELYLGLQDKAEMRIEELNESFQSSQKLYKQSSRKAHTLEAELNTCRIMLQSAVDRELEAKNEKKLWSVEKLELEHTVERLRRQLEALNLVMKESDEAAQEKVGGAAAQLEGALIREEKLRNELAVTVSEQKSALEEVKQAECRINSEMEAKTSAEMLYRGFMQTTLAAMVALSEVESVLVRRAKDDEPQGAALRKQFLAKAEAKISSLGKGNGVNITATASRTGTDTTNEIDNASNVMKTMPSLEEDSEKFIDELKSEMLKLSSSVKEAALKLNDDSQSHHVGAVSCLKKVCDSEERERELNAAVQRGAEKLEALQAELLDSKVERDRACTQLSTISRQLQHAEQKLICVSSSREDPVCYQSSSISPEQLQAKTVAAAVAHATTITSTLENEMPTPAGVRESCSSELHDWKERLRAEEQLLHSSGRAVKNQKDCIRTRQRDLKVRRDAWRREWSRFEEPIVSVKKSELSSPTIQQQRESFSAAKKSLDKEIVDLNTATSQIKESSRWLKNREQKVKELSEAIARASAENEGLSGMARSGTGPPNIDHAASGYMPSLPSHSTFNSNKSSSGEEEEEEGSSSFASKSVRQILRDLQEDVKELQSRMKRAVPDYEAPLNEGYTYVFNVPAPPDTLPSASTHPRPQHNHQHGYYASYPHKQPFPVFHDPENLESSLEAWLNARGRDWPDDAATNKPSMTTTQPPPNLQQLSADRREAHLAVSEAVEKLSGITADMGVHRFGASYAVAAASSSSAAKEVINDPSKKMSGSLSRSAAARGLSDATKVFINTMGRATAVTAS